MTTTTGTIADPQPRIQRSPITSTSTAPLSTSTKKSENKALQLAAARHSD